MIIWRGWGWLALVVFAIVSVAFDEATNAWFAVPAGEHYRDAHPWASLLGGLITSAACWYLGKWLEARELAKAQVVIDKETGQEMRLIGRNDMFWIPVKWWSVVWLVITVFMVIPREKVELTYPRTLWRDFETRHAETGLSDLAYNGKAVLLVKGEVTALEPVSAEAGVAGMALAMHVDDGKTVSPVFVPEGPRLLLYPLPAAKATDKHPAPDMAEWRGMLGKIVTLRCTGAESELDTERRMRAIRMLDCSQNS
jgi:hypothetical protein